MGEFAMRVVFYGNNLNYGDNFLRHLRACGVEGTLLLAKYDHGQEYPEWWSNRGRDRRVTVELPRSVTDWSVLPPAWHPDMRRVHDVVRAHDVFVMMEDGPALFQGFNERPKVLLAQGHDIIGIPFLVPGYWYGSIVDDVHAVSGALRRRAVLEGAVASVRAVARPLPRLLRWSAVQARQRKGIRECQHVLLLPFQEPHAKLLGLEPARVGYLPFMIDEETMEEFDPADVERLRARYGTHDVVFFHPARQFFTARPGNPYTKDNDKAVAAYLRFARHSTLSSKLLLVEKGHPEDIAHLKKLIAESGLAAKVEWLGEMDHVRMRGFYRLDNVVVLDQFNPLVSSMGNIGREASYFGRPLITSLAADIHTFYGSDMPPHVMSAATTEDIEKAMVQLAAAGAAQRRSVSQQAQAWTRRHLTPSAVMPKYLRLLERALGATSSR